ncbi:hypothetical protein FisN_27Lu087 [Fistulifera solaris]|uniref:Uncharacterized protein n=1 Tax=Fistulifera solaris TaxID=1519565 RepID=A0A1Z5JQR4_FISSO|nr:hypothetical protein FisN_27Lu087 [Fistulifera solaris]|eukprot:GAX16360.1 hypothetical protein FisN_27Lu087 [Fistulifera solaris]
MALPHALWKHLAANDITIVVDNARAPKHPHSSRNNSPPLIRAWTSERTISPPPPPPPPPPSSQRVAEMSKQDIVGQPTLSTIKLIDVYKSHGSLSRGVSRPCRGPSSTSTVRAIAEVLETTMN